MIIIFDCFYLIIINYPIFSDLLPRSSPQTFSSDLVLSGLLIDRSSGRSSLLLSASDVLQPPCRIWLQEQR